MNKTNIEYIDYSWNPFAMRCTPVSEGCAHCWHITMADRLKNNPKMPTGRRDSYSGGPPVLIEDELAAPLKLKKPSIIGVQFMGDLFHEDVPQEWINTILRHAMNTSRHIYLFLTKRPARMRAAFDRWCNHDGYKSWETGESIPFKIPPFFWLGVTAENQQRLDERVSILLQIPAMKHFVSIEPMLGPVNLHLGDTQSDVVWRRTHGGNYQREFLDWCILGGESGPGARPMNPDWPRSVRDQCQEVGVPFFFKQWGSCPYPPGDITNWVVAGYDPYDRKGGRLLEGREWNEVPK